MKTFSGFYYYVCTNPKHTCCVDLIHNHSAFMCPFLLSSEVSLLPLFSCVSKNLLPFLQVNLFLKNNSVYPEIFPSLYTWWAESSKLCEGFRLGEFWVESTAVLRLVSHTPSQWLVHTAWWVCAGLLCFPTLWFQFLNGWLTINA